MKSTGPRAIHVGLLALALTSAFSGRAQAQASDDVRDAHMVLQKSTAVSLLVTGTLGTLVAINQPTLFGDGRCAEDSDAEPLLGDYGCRGLSVLHGVSSILSTVLYTATVTTEFAAFDWPGREEHGTAFDAASGVHLAGMAVLPILGIVTAVPAVIGLEGQAADDFQRVMRTLHLTFAYPTVGAFVATTAVEF